MFADWLTYCSLLHNLAHNRHTAQQLQGRQQAAQKAFLTENTVTCIFQGMEEKEQCECAINQRQRALLPIAAFPESSSLRCLLRLNNFWAKI